MLRRTAISVGLVGMTLMAACSDQSTVSTEPANAAFDKGGVPNGGNGNDGDEGEGALHRKVLELRTSNLAGRSAKGSGTGISYHGGPVLQAGTNVVAIYWASSPIYLKGPAVGTSSTSSTAADSSLVGGFLRAFGGTPYFNINSTYTNSAGAPIANVVRYTGFWANDDAPANGAKVTDAQMASMLSSGFQSGKLQYDPSTLYLIFSAGTVNLGGGFGTQYCGYHTHATVSTPSGPKVVLYAAMPYGYAYPSSCTNGTPSPNGDPGADGELSVLAHEIEETTTDMLGNAWYDSRGYENGDKCVWNFGTTQTAGNGGVYNMIIGDYKVLVQQNWVNSGKGGCVLQW